MQFYISQCVLINLFQVFSKVQDIVKSLFPYSKEVAIDNSVVALSDYLSDNSKIWVALRDIELSHALTYQWAGSSSNKAILSALGIDSRNMVSIITI